jgi:hypothetical protein
MFELFELFELFDYSFTDQQLVMRLSIFVHTRRYLIILLSYYLIILSLLENLVLTLHTRFKRVNSLLND